MVKAENDLTNAAHVLKLAAECPTDTVCFHAQQCVEKYLKALLVFHGIDFPKTHDIEKLVALLPARADTRLTAEEQGRLTDYATTTRYPGSGEMLLTEARRAVVLARRVRRQVRSLLPSEIRRVRRGRP
ncbi:MAG: HEPN domain-containing protein [Gammaproteobacteria bacterium]|nr:HEPN domain-containing protein [Gammaproteobacteria bacterium]